MGRRHGRRQDRRWALSWSPEQIARRLPVEFPEDESLRISHEAIYQTPKRIGVRIARKGIESSERLGRRRWVIERTMSWLTGYRRLNHRYERHPRNYLDFLGLAAALCCYKRLVRLTT
ncbi:hypothetical protein GCM10010381_61760 [Streptomyces xantholiticus]|nr:hypothetical protein GCM10010381_61760 [Streptomyces xantholiticus]